MTVADSQPGHDAPRCGARKRQGEGTCTQVAGWGTDHVGEGRCKLHGGSTRSVAAGARLRLVENEARELFGKVAPTPIPIDNPLDAYRQLAGRVMAWLELMDSKLDDLQALGYESEYVGVQIQAVVQLYERAMDRANHVLGTYARLKIDERLAAITEAQKLMVIRAIEAALDEAGLHGEGRENATRRAARYLRSVA